MNEQYFELNTVSVSEHALLIPPEQLSGEALAGLLEAFVVREGTDYGELEWSFAEKVEQVRQQLQRGDIVIVFDLTTESCTLMTKIDWKNLEREQRAQEQEQERRGSGQ